MITFKLCKPAHVSHADWAEIYWLDCLLAVLFVVTLTAGLCCYGDAAVPLKKRPAECLQDMALHDIGGIPGPGRCAGCHMTRRDDGNPDAGLLNW